MGVAEGHQQDIDFAAMLCSRVCHDMANSILALSAGLEFLEESSDSEMHQEATGLLKSSTEKITARLQYARLAYGASGSAGAELDLRQVTEVLDGIAQFEKPEFVWDVPMELLEKNKAKILLNLANITLGCLPRGGKIYVKMTTSPFQIALVANGKMVKVQEDAVDILLGKKSDSQNNVYNIQAYYTNKLAAIIGADIGVEKSDTCLLYTSPSPRDA